jgi:2-isopropylmalate synthase
MSSDPVVFFDTTLRDGEQSPGCSMTTQEKLTMAHALEDLGVDIIEAGFAMASEGDFAAIATITQAIRKPRIASLARAKTEDIEMAARALQFADRARIHVFLASSDLHLEYKLKMTRAEALEQCGESVCAWRGRWPTMWSFLPRTRRVRIAIFWWRWCVLPWRQARRPSTCPTPWAT